MIWLHQTLITIRMAWIGDHEGEGVGGVRSKVEQFAAIRRDHRVEGLSIRALSDRHGVHRRTVRRALESAVPPPRKTPQRIAPRLAPHKSAIDAMLRSDVDAPTRCCRPFVSARQSRLIRSAVNAKSSFVELICSTLIR